MPHADLPNPGDLVREMNRLSRQLDEALSFTKEQSHTYARAENDYRMARARLQLEANEAVTKQHGIEKPTVDEKGA